MQLNRSGLALYRKGANQLVLGIYSYRANDSLTG
jgi:hypothetical protein